MTTYLKNMARWKPNDLKNKSFANVQELFENAMKRVNTFVDMDTESVEGSERREEESSSKRAGDDLEQKPTKKQKDEDLDNLSILDGVQCIEYSEIWISTSSLHRSSNISASLGRTNEGFYISFKFGISGLLHQWSLQIPYRNDEGLVKRYLAFGRHLEKIHVTWAHLEKKRTRLQTNTKTHQDLKSQRLETASPYLYDAVTVHLFRQRPTAKGVGLRVADSRTGNHFKDDFRPLETIRTLYNVFGRRSHLGFEGETSEPKGREYFSVLPKYRVILPMPTQTILDAPPRYIGLYTHCFSLANLRLPLNDFFCEVLQYFKVHISRLNPFGCSKLTTFIVMCKAYDCEPSVKLFRGFFNLCKADTIVPSKFPQLLLKENMLDVKSFKDKLPSGIEQNPQFQCLGRYPASARAFNDPILFLAGLQSSWEHGQQRPAIFVGGKGFNIVSPSVSINTKPVRADKEPAVEPATEPVNERVETTADSGGSPKGDTFVIHAGSVAARIRERKSRRLFGVERCHCLSSQDLCHNSSRLEGFLDNHPDVDLLDLHDRCYARQAVVDNAMNRRSHELLKVIEKLSGEADVMRARKLAREEECEGLRAKCEAAMTDFDKNPAVLLLQEKISSLAAEAKEHKGNLDRLMLESQKWSGYQVSLSALELKVASLGAEKANLKATVALLRQEIEEVKHDRREVVSKLAYKQVARIKEPFDLSKVKGYRPSYEKEHTQASNDLATATFSYLNEYVADASAFMEALLSKKPPTL
ncbi:hypothetical protein Tco_1031125 [Tanacetum coccineum]|uniref:Transposase (putative) gypsy type domain-containing protein n=1 Tax=Tanacetum coccineum TaxID=301880 RepID=A0ABQ5G9U3_9ASTR